jgi:DNA-binding CsgD family transcriptional regulator
MHDDSIVRLLSTLYAAPTEPRRWNDFLRQIGESCGVDKAALIAHDMSRNHHIIVAGRGDALKESGNQYEKYYWQFDEWTARLPKVGLAGQVHLGEEVWPEPAFLKSVFYNEFLRQYEICRLAAVFFPGKQGSFDGISFYRARHEEKFDPEQITLLNTVAPHLKIALQTRRKLAALEGRVSDLETALDAIASALILLDSNQNVIFVNRKARTLLGTDNSLYVHKSKLAERDSRKSSRLQQLIAKALANPAHADRTGGGSMPLYRPGKRPMHILVSPLHATDNPVCTKASVAVFIDDPEENPIVPAEVLRTLFGLTPAETRLALSLLNGHSASETADLGRVSRETVKSQMKALLAKTGSRRQGELIRLLSRLPGIAV